MRCSAHFDSPIPRKGRASSPASYMTCDTDGMTATITFRPDDDARLALEELTADGTPVSVVVRDALVQAAARHARDRLRREVEGLAHDPLDRAEAAQVLRDMEYLRAW